MPIPDALHDSARREARQRDPQDVARQLGLSSASEQHKYSCPFCASSDALHVNPASQYAPDGGGQPAAKCFSCGETCSDTIALLEKVDGLDYLDALEALSSYQLRERDAPSSGAESPETSRDASCDSRPHDVDGTAEAEDGADSNANGDTSPPSEVEIAERTRRARETLAYGWQRLDSDVVAPLAYLETRGIPEDLARWAGVRPLPANFWRDLLEDIGPERAVDAGIFNVDGGHAHPSSSSMAFAYHHWGEDGEPQLDTLRFRKPRPGAPVLSVCSNASCIPGEVAPTMPRSPYLAPFALPAAREEGCPLYVVEGEIDALSLWRCGRPAIGAPGAHSWRDAYSEGWHGIPHVIALGDGDGAGEDFTEDVEASIGRVYGARWRDQHFRKRTVDGGDANDLLQAHGEEWLSDLLARLETRLTQKKTVA